MLLECCKVIFNASAKDIYDAWLSSENHTLMTGGYAIAALDVGFEFTAWDGYITGKNLILEPNKRIVQSWRTTNFQENEPDSQIEITLKEDNGVTELTLFHSKVSEKGEHYIKGWEEHYFEPMKLYFQK